MIACLTLANCASKLDPKYGVSTSPRVVADGTSVPKGGGTYRVGKPYVVAGRTYVPEENVSYRAEGMASWYGDDFHGRLTANGEVYDMNSISAAHPTLPMPCYVRVTNLANKKSIVVRVNDRGPFAANRVIDLSVRTAKLLEFHSRGLARVRVEYVGRAPLEGSDDRQLVATLRDGEAARRRPRSALPRQNRFCPSRSRRLRSLKTACPICPKSLPRRHRGMESQISRGSAARRRLAMPGSKPWLCRLRARDMSPPRTLPDVRSRLFRLSRQRAMMPPLHS